MRFIAFACDYDETLASHGRVSSDGVAALKRLASSGRKLVLVTGRELDDLLGIFPEADVFDRIVAENGALVHRPASREKALLGERPPRQFVDALIDRGVSPLSVGEVIVATTEPNQGVVLSTIRDLGLELQVIFNKGSVMVLPSGINKGTGLSRALRELGLSAHNCVAIGDAENDHAFLSISECSAAVSNALPTLKERADIVTLRESTAGVIKLIDQLLSDDLRGYEGRLSRHDILFGEDERGQPVFLRSYGTTLLIAGASGAGKSTTATALIERIVEREYQCCLIDPEGDYSGFERAVVLGSSNRAPVLDEILQVLDNRDSNCVVNMVGVPSDDRSPFFAALLARLQELRARTGRPHWIAIDEAHHLLPSAWGAAPVALPKELPNTIFMTLEPRQLSAEVLSSVNEVIAVGPSAHSAVEQLGSALEVSLPPLAPPTLERAEVLLWRFRRREPPMRVRVAAPRSDQRRHRRKYAEGELKEDRSFYFRGPQGKLNLRAQNLIIFNQIAQGVDDATWLYHLRRGEYSRWFREEIKDEDLASEAADIERNANSSAVETRQRMRQAIERRYTIP